MTKSQFERAEEAIVFGPIYRLHAIRFYRINDSRPWDRLRPAEQETWCELARTALAVNRRLIELTFGSPASAVGAGTDDALYPGAAGGDPAHFPTPAGTSEPRRATGPAVGETGHSEPQQQVFSPLRQYQSPIRQVK